MSSVNETALVTAVCCVLAVLSVCCAAFGHYQAAMAAAITPVTLAAGRYAMGG